MKPTVQRKENPNHKGAENPQILIQDVHLTQLRRTSQDMADFLAAVRSAEAITNPNRKLLAELYQNALTDGYLRALLDKRTRAVTTSSILLEGIDDEALERRFEKPWFHKLIRLIMSARYHGFATIELIVKEGEIIDAVLVPREHCKPDKFLVTKYVNGSEAEAYRITEPPFDKYVVQVTDYTDDGKCLGLLLNCTPYTINMKGDIQHWAGFNEIFGQPVRVFKYNPHDAESKVQAEKTAREAGSSLAIVVPDSVDYDIVEANGSQAAVTYKDFMQELRTLLAITVLGNKLTTDADGKGSYALGEIHAGVEKGVNLEDKTWVEFILNEQFKPIFEAHGYAIGEGRFSIPDVQKMGKEKLIEIYEKLNLMYPGQLDPAFVFQEFDVPEDHILEPQPTPQPEPTPEPPTDPEEEEPTTDLSAQLNRWYPQQMVPAVELAAGADPLRDTIERIIAQLYSGELAPGSIDQSLWQQLATKLWVEVEQGYGQQLSSLNLAEPDKLMLKALKEDVFVFSQFKTYQQLRAATDMLLDPTTGQLRTFAAFREAVLGIHQQYNIHHLRAEYNHAQASGQMASKWVDATSNADILPYAEFDSVEDDRARHLAYDGIMEPLDHPFWDTHWPPLDWGCRCTVRTLSGGIPTPDERLADLPELKPMFQNNVGKTKNVFPKSHPYYQVRDEDQAKAMARWDFEF